MDWLRKIRDILMPDPEYDEEQEREKEEVKTLEAPAKTIEQKAESLTTATASTTVNETAENVVSSAQVATGVGAGYGSAMKFNPDSIMPPPSFRPSLTVLENKMNELNVKIYNPTKYEEASQIAADILSKNAAVVNYDYVEMALQIRICDFLNGVCYVTDGFTDKISDKIFLYVPDGVDTVDIAEAVAAANNNNRRAMFAS